MPESRGSKIVYLSIGLFGIVLVLLGLIIQIPYVVSQTVRKDLAIDFTQETYPIDDAVYPLYDNGTLREIQFPQSSTMKYECYYLGYGWNKSIVQIDLAMSGPLIFKIVRLNYGDDTIEDIYFSEEFHSGWFENTADGWITIFWTPLRGWFDRVGFVFENPSAQQIIFSFKITQYLLKETATNLSTQYRTPLDTNFGYAGMVLLSSVVMLDMFYPSIGQQLKLVPKKDFEARRKLLESIGLIVAMAIFCVLLSSFTFLIFSRIISPYNYTSEQGRTLAAESVLFGCLMGYAVGIAAGIIVNKEDQEKASQPDYGIQMKPST